MRSGRVHSIPVGSLKLVFDDAVGRRHGCSPLHARLRDAIGDITHAYVCVCPLPPQEAKKSVNEGETYSAAGRVSHF